jgi:HPt (histidine-containing phosphotransfer) domain-containing protein
MTKKGSVQEQQKKCINLDYLKQRTKDNPKLIMEMIALYLEQTPPLVSAMKQSLENKDWPKLQAAVHKMIPSFLIVGIREDIGNIAKKIKEFAGTQQHTDEISDMVLQLENVCVQACKELEEEFDSIKKTTL